MYFYNLLDFQEHITLSHRHKFTNEEFEAMCEEAPKEMYLDIKPIYEISNIEEHLISKYGFERLECESEFDTSKKVK